MMILILHLADDPAVLHHVIVAQVLTEDEAIPEEEELEIKKKAVLYGTASLTFR